MFKVLTHEEYKKIKTKKIHIKSLEMKTTMSEMKNIGGEIDRG